MKRASRSESSIQKAVVDYARKQGLLAIKQSTMGKFGTAGWPDYLFITRHAVCFFIEFKRAGNTMTDLQKERARQLGFQGVSVYMIDNVELGKKVVDKWTS